MEKANLLVTYIKQEYMTLGFEFKWCIMYEERKSERNCISHGILYEDFFSLLDTA